VPDKNETYIKSKLQQMNLTLFYKE